MTVYVLQEMGRNIRSAEKFGDLKVVLPDNKQIVLSSGPLTFKLKHELKDFNDHFIPKLVPSSLPEIKELGYFNILFMISSLKHV